MLGVSVVALFPCEYLTPSGRLSPPRRGATLRAGFAENLTGFVPLGLDPLDGAVLDAAVATIGGVAAARAEPVARQERACRSAPARP